ncbi:hypothetical protein B0H67DRAFT_265239 [Lasiosphaeris hirsuta]|uniref:Uncharacterized protein n=1 Tax=Lasiosphaeris hirsuta TaxID=260670 RepID=A0AA40A7T3_9PEZI|nr:hypothetical protein B0H67DRAFT_265239 [Lasiosphaeris hirsuta]
MRVSIAWTPVAFFCVLFWLIVTCSMWDMLKTHGSTDQPRWPITSPRHLDQKAKQIGTNRMAVSVGCTLAMRAYECLDTGWDFSFHQDRFLTRSSQRNRFLYRTRVPCSL